MTERTCGTWSRLLRIADGVRLRREHFGGIVFDRRAGTTLDVDRCVFRGLERLHERGVLSEDALAQAFCGRKISEHKLGKARDIVNRLVHLAILDTATAASVEASTSTMTSAPEDARIRAPIAGVRETIC